MNTWKEVVAKLIDKPFLAIAIVLIAVAGPQMFNASKLDSTELVNVLESVALLGGMGLAAKKFAS